MSEYLRRKFKRDFSEICEMWTGEDGTLMSLAIARTSEVGYLFKQHWAFATTRAGKVIEAFDPSRIKDRFVYRDDTDYPGQFGDCRRTWRVCDERTDYPICEYELEYPR